MDDEQMLYQVVIPEDVFERIRSDKAFIEILKLARIVNSLQFVIGAYAETRPSATPRQLRQGFNAFLSSAALIAEGHKVLKNAASRLGAFPEYGAIQELFADHEVMRRDDGRLLYAIRNKIVFHFDDEVFRESLPVMAGPEIVFARSHTSRDMDIDYSLGDELVWRYLSHTFTDRWEVSDEEKAAMVEDILDLALQFVQGANLLITRVLRESGWAVLRERHQ